MQAFAFNIRRPQFQDPLVRRAFNLAFDFEWSNKNLFYDQYTRIGSYFDNSDPGVIAQPAGSPPGGEFMAVAAACR
jgi:microcin C transport system substrate-binding protein